MFLNLETGGTVELHGRSKSSNPHIIRISSHYLPEILVSDNDPLLRRISSIMILNPQTQKYELPPPRWFNKDTGDYENIKPMYFLDPNNPTLGLVPPSRVVREDDAFRQFMEEKETKRRIRVQREAEEAERARREALNPAPPPTAKISNRKDKTRAKGFDDQLAKKSFQEVTGKVISKRDATAFAGPSADKEALMREKLEERYASLKPFVPEDEMIEKLTPEVNVNKIINAWKNSPAIRSSIKKNKPAKTEGERVKALVQNKYGKREWTFAAMRGSYRPPNTMETESRNTGGWVVEGRLPLTLQID